MKITTTHLLIGTAAAFALLALRARARGSSSVPTTAANRAAQIRADAFRHNLFGNELLTSPDFYI